MEMLRAGGAVFLPERFTYHHADFLYQDVTHLGRYAGRGSVNFIPVASRLEISVWIRGIRDPIILKNPAAIVGTTGKLKAAYELLAKKTFKTRASSYLKQWADCGCFDYYGLRFLASEEVECAAGTLDLNSCRFAWQPFEVRFKEKGRVLGKKAVASTLVDQDVLFFLTEEALWHPVRVSERWTIIVDIRSAATNDSRRSHLGSPFWRPESRRTGVRLAMRPSAS